jgi:hypothetical protein
MADNTALIEVMRLIQSKPREFFDGEIIPSLPVPFELFRRFCEERYAIPDPVCSSERLVSAGVQNILFGGVFVHPEVTDG